MRLPIEVRDLEEQIDLLFEQAIGALQRGRLLAAEEVVAGEVDKHAGADAGDAVGIAGDAAGDGAGAVVLRRSGLRLEAEAVGKGPAARFSGLQQNGLAGCAAIGIFDGGIDFVEEGELVEIALGFEQGGLVERIAGVKGDGAVHGFRPRVVKPGDQNVAHENLRAFGDVEDDIDFVGISGLRLLGDVDADLLKAAAQVFGEQGVAVTGRFCGESNWPAAVLSSGVSLAASTWSLPSMLHRADAELLAFFDAVGDGERSGAREATRACRCRLICGAAVSAGRSRACWSRE